MYHVAGTKKHFDMALGQWFQKTILKLCPQFCPQSPQVHGRSRLAISDTGEGGRQRPSVYAILGLFGHA